MSNSQRVEADDDVARGLSLGPDNQFLGGSGNASRRFDDTFNETKEHLQIATGSSFKLLL